jgi:hypothetical protein
VVEPENMTFVWCGHSLSVTFIIVERNLKGLNVVSYKILARFKSFLVTFKTLLGFTTKGRNLEGRKLIRSNHNRPKNDRNGQVDLQPRALFGPPARFGLFLCTKSQMFEEIRAKIHRVIVGLRRDYRAVMKLSVYQEKSKVLLGSFNIQKKSHSVF